MEGRCGRAGDYRSRKVEESPLHWAVRGGLQSFLAQAADAGGLPRHVVKELRGYLACGVLAHGFCRVRCTACGKELLLPFSCKGRGVCPSCNGRRAEDTAVYLEEHVLPVARYRQWTLSLPLRVRWHLLRKPELVGPVLEVFLRALFGWQRGRARQLGVEGQPGAVSFIQRFGSALQPNVHFHVLVPEGRFGAEGTLLPLPPPSGEEVGKLAEVVARRITALLVRRGVLEEEAWPQNALEQLAAESLQRRLPLPQQPPAPPKPHARCATVAGYSLHAATQVGENDRVGLMRLVRYGSRGALALERLSRGEDGRLRYRMKRPAPDGSTHLVLTPVELLRRLAPLVPPPGQHLVRFHGVFAPNAKLRAKVVPAPRGEPPTPEPSAPPLKRKPRPRLNWAELLKRTFGVDLLTCELCGGRRRVLAAMTEPKEARRVLEHLRLPSVPLPLAPAQGPPQRELWE